jgi:hypothetical protein
MKFCRNGPACGICQYVDHIVISGERFYPDDIFECDVDGHHVIAEVFR